MDYTTAIELKPDYAAAYTNRGKAYQNTGDFDLAFQDHTAAIKLKPDYADAYFNRGKMWLHLRGWQKARLDLAVAVAMGIDIIASFHSDYENVADFEGRNGIKLPEDLAAMLTPPQ